MLWSQAIPVVIADSVALGDPYTIKNDWSLVELVNLRRDDYVSSRETTATRSHWQLADFSTWTMTGCVSAAINDAFLMRHTAEYIELTFLVVILVVLSMISHSLNHTGQLVLWHCCTSFQFFNHECNFTSLCKLKFKSI